MRVGLAAAAASCVAAHHRQEPCGLKAGRGSTRRGAAPLLLAHALVPSALITTPSLPASPAGPAGRRAAGDRARLARDGFDQCHWQHQARALDPHRRKARLSKAGLPLGLHHGLPAGFGAGRRGARAAGLGHICGQGLLGALREHDAEGQSRRGVMHASPCDHEAAVRPK